jgi:quinol monooxygenase YgiN
MIRHVVMWELHDPADAGAFCDALASCANLVEGTRSYELAVRDSALAASVDVCLIATFDDAETLSRYMEHPRHRAVSARIAPLRRQRHVIDFEVED